MIRGARLCFGLLLISGAVNLSNAQTIFTCIATAVPPVVRGEGITERTGDILMNCSGGSPGARITGNFSIFLTVSITNRVVGNTVTDVVFTVDNGAGPQPANVPGTIAGPSTLVYNGLSFTLSAGGAVTLRIANIRVAANQLALIPNSSIQALIGFNSGSLISLTNTQFTVATPVRGLYAGFSSKLVCTSKGSAFPDNFKSFASFVASLAAFNSTRVTEGFGDAFSQRGAWQSLNADTATRILVRYAGFPEGARLSVPDVIAGSDAVQATAGGDFGAPVSGGQYAPTVNGTLLLARVLSADANGAGGTPIYTPGPPGSPIVMLDSMSEVTLINGSGIAVYEVVDANPSVRESAQFPTFLSLAPFSSDPILTSEDVSLAPVSKVTAVSATDPIPRFQAVPVPPDCGIVGDCGAFYYPHLAVDTTQLQFTAQAGSNFQIAYVRVNNQGGSVMHWTVSVNYTNGSGWLRVFPTDGTDNATVRVDAIPGNLAPGTYKAILAVDAGPLAGTANISITLVITGSPPPPVQPPVVNSIVNAATFAPAPLVSGSLTTLLGSKLTGNSVLVTLDGIPAKILYDSDVQINLFVPVELGAKSLSQLVVIVDGNSSISQAVTLAQFAPGIFKNGILNQDNSVNDADHPAPLATVIQIFATGLSGNGVITGRISGRLIDQPNYAGPAPGLLGVQQVNLTVPADLAGALTADVSVCGGAAGRPDLAVCSPAVPVVLAH